MQKLEPIHIHHIEQFLVDQYHLYFIDIRAEVVDHIASEIEHDIVLGKTYEEAFIDVIAKWDTSLHLSKFFYKGIPFFIAKQWIKDRLKLLVESILFGVLSLIGIMTLFDLFAVEDNSAKFFYKTFLIAGAGCVLAMHIINYKLVQKTPCKTARGQFLRLEVKRSVLINLIIVGNGISVLNKMLSFEYIFQLYAFYVLILLFNKIRWYLQYKQAKILEIKWLAVV